MSADAPRPRARKRRFAAARRLLLRVGAASALLLALVAPGRAAFQIDVRPGYGVTARGWLSDYSSGLRGTEYDTPVYVMEGCAEGGRALLFAGEHADEMAGPVAATVLLENGVVSRGKLFVIPCLNAAGMSVPAARGGVAREWFVRTKSGRRALYRGDRRLPPRGGESDPARFRHPSGYVHEDGRDWRDVNRNYPGAARGTPAQMICHGVVQLILREGVGTCLDAHEATAPEPVFDPRDGSTHPGGSLSYTLVAHPKCADAAIEMILNLEDRGVRLKAERSVPGFRGISHYEIGEATPCAPFLSETPDPAQNGHAVLADPVNDMRHPLEERVGIQLEIFREWLAACGRLTGSPVEIEGLPRMEQIARDGVGAWLR